MRFSAYILFLLAVTLPLYIFGYGNAISTIEGFRTITIPFQNSTVTNTYSMGNSTIQIACQTGDIYCSSPQNNTTIMWSILALILGFIGVNLLLGFAAMYVVPALIIIAIISFVVMPYSFLSGMPWPLDVMLFAIFNTITILSVVDFIRGGA